MKPLLPHFQPTIPVYGRPEFASILQRVFEGHLLEEPLPADSAYQLIEDELLADAKPGLNLATFCNETFTDPYGEKIIANAVKKNFIDHTEYPGSNLAEKRIIRIIATELGTTFDESELEDSAAEAQQGLYGSATIGSSEAIMLALIAHRFMWEQKHRVLLDHPQWGIRVDPRDRPVVLMSAHVHGCWDKYCRYYNAVPLYVDIQGPPYAIHDGETIRRILETPLDSPDSPEANYLRSVLGYIETQEGRVIGDLVMCVGTVVGTTFTGNYDNIPSIDRNVDHFCNQYNARHADVFKAYEEAYKKWYESQFQASPIRIPQLMDIPIHVDAAAPGFVLMYASNGDAVKFNFRDCPLRVLSINISNHKFGMTFTGLGSVVFKNARVVDPSLVYNIAYLGGSFDDYTVNFSRGAAMVIMQYYNFLNFGRAGYRAIMDNCIANTAWFVNILERDPLLSPYLKNISNIPLAGEKGEIILPIIALAFPDGDPQPAWTLTNLSDKLAESGWVVPAYHIPVRQPEDTEGIEVLRIVVQQSVTRDKLATLLRNLRTAVERLVATSPAVSPVVSPAERPVTDPSPARRRSIARHTACLC